MQNSIELKSGVRLYYRDWGKGYPLLFVSSWALNSDAWEYQMLTLSEIAIESFFPADAKTAEILLLSSLS